MDENVKDYLVLFYNFFVMKQIVQLIYTYIF